MNRLFSAELVRVGLWSALLLPVLCGLAVAQECVIPRFGHPWARFEAGSWKQVRVTTENFSEAGKPTGTSVTETKSLLLSVEGNAYTLQVDVSIDVAGKRFSSEPKVTRQGFQGEAAGQAATVRQLGDRLITVKEQTIATHTAEIQIADGQSRKVIWLNYRSSGASRGPFVLGRRSMTLDAEGKVQQETIVETTSLDGTRHYLARQLPIWETRTTQKLPKGRIVTDEVHSAQVPGGVVEHVSEEFDEQEKLLRRSRLELVNFGVASGVQQPPIRRRPPRRARR